MQKTITYTSSSGEEITETHYFHLSKAEMINLALTHSDTGGYAHYLREVIKTKDKTAIWDEFKKIVALAYGQRSSDGTQFVKSDDLRETFEASKAFSELVKEIAHDRYKAIEFVNGILRS